MVAVRQDVRVDVENDGDLTAAMQYGSHPSMHARSSLVWPPLVEDLSWSREVVLHQSAAREIIKYTFLFPRWWGPSPKTKQKGDSRLAVRERGRTAGVNGHTTFGRAHKCDVGRGAVQRFGAYWCAPTGRGHRSAHLHLQDGR